MRYNIYPWIMDTHVCDENFKFVLTKYLRVCKFDTVENFEMIKRRPGFAKVSRDLNFCV